MTDTQGARVTFRVGGMDCAACARKIETAVARLPGVTGVDVSVMTGTLTVEGADLRRVPAEVEALGYTLEGGSRHAGHDGHDHRHEDHQHEHDHNHSHDHDHDHDAHDGHAHSHADFSGDQWWRSPKARLILSCGAALVVAHGIGVVVPQSGQWPFLVALLIGLVPIARHAWAGIRAGTPFSIETLMTISAGGAFIIGAAEEAAMVVVLFLIGELLEGLATQRARAGISGLTKLVPDVALVARGGALVETSAADLVPGDIITVRPGDRIAADGVIVEGESAIDEAPVTGESVPVTRGPGGRVFAGTINTDAVLRVEVTARAADNTIARVVRLVEEAQASKAPTERFIERFATRYTPAVLVLGALVAVVPPLFFGGEWGVWIYRGLAVLLIGCPCALVISTPAAIAAGLSAGARRGLLLKGGSVLEGLGRVTTVAFDKTGTLTQGRPVVTDVEGVGLAVDEVLAYAAALERGSNHPLALAILSRAEGLTIPQASGVRALAGKGVAGIVNGLEVALLSPRALGDAGLSVQHAAVVGALNGGGKTVSVLTVDGVPAGFIALRDELRPDARAALEWLARLGVSSVMLTGDNRATAGAIADELGLAPAAGRVHAELLPEDKSRIVRALQAKGEVVAKVGDGINDAPALAVADVGIAMGGGTDVALETADAAALHGRMADIPAMIALSRATMANIRQNIVLALGLKAVFLITTILGVTGLWPAILADTGATVLVTANALRLLGWKARG
ncbi:Cd2+/Zn2+-exporting ATPase [Pseudochelatococcus lubricantis]|uniref:P-type Zn(2+) transporter n=1 Tax=Pseudochelatococcus lubricantis TaxID=1538102 RepID=A0ABX0UYP7_9HYPH|nr:heavy metal translocating P-type ATPase [Pseudochelatococcus lubricantis]NIJ57065.1 Cd2+/Zn2+-exporting ATPase [Pseudochelatococcus lubricantis]